MKINRQLLNRIIKEELGRVIREQDSPLIGGPTPKVLVRRREVEPPPAPERLLQLDKDAAREMSSAIKRKLSQLKAHGRASGRLEFTFDVEDTERGSIMKNLVLDDSTHRSLEDFSELRMQWWGDPGVVPAGKYTYVAVIQ